MFTYGVGVEKWLGLGDGENFSRRRLYNGVSLWFMVNSHTSENIESTKQADNILEMPLDQGDQGYVVIMNSRIVLIRSG